MRTLLRVLLWSGVTVLALYLVLRFVLFPIVPSPELDKYVPLDADIVVIADTRELLGLAFSDFISDPGGAGPLDLDEDDDEENEDRTLGTMEILKKAYWHGLSLPDRLLMWSHQGAVSLVLPLDDDAELESFFQESGQQMPEMIKKGGTWIDSLTHWTVTEDALILTEFETLGEFRDVTPVNESAWGFHDGSTSVFLNGIGRATVTSEKGGLVLMLRTNDTYTFQSLGTDTGDEGGVSIGLKIVPSSSYSSLFGAGLEDVFSKNNVNSTVIDSLWNGELVFRMEGLRTQTIETISYEYNEDFEKVEIKSVADLVEADFKLGVGLVNPLDSLFYKNSWVKEIDGEERFLLYPLQKVYAYESPDMFVLSSAIEDSSSFKLEGHAKFLNAQFDLFTSNEMSDSSSAIQRTFGLRSIEGKCVSEEEIELKIKFRNNERHGIFSLIETLSEISSYSKKE